MRYRNDCGNFMGAQQAVPVLPTGFPTGGTATPLTPASVFQGAVVPTMPSMPGIPSTPGTQAMNGTSGIPGTTGAPGWTQMPATVESTMFTPGFLRTQIGRNIRVEFLIGTNSMTDRTGTLVAVGASYIIIRPIQSDDLMLCDIYSIRFVTIIM